MPVGNTRLHGAELVLFQHLLLLLVNLILELSAAMVGELSRRQHASICTKKANEKTSQ